MMEEQVPPNTSPTPTVPAVTTPIPAPTIPAPIPVPPTPAEPPKVNKPLIVSAIVVALLLLATTGFLAYQNFQSTNQPINQPTSVPSPTADPTANWKTFTNTKYNFSFKYPADYSVGQNGMNSDHPELSGAVFAGDYNAKDFPDEPRFTVSLINYSDKTSTLEEKANEYFNKWGTYSVETTYPAENNKVVYNLTKTNFQNKEAYTFTIKGSYYTDGATEGLSKSRERKYVLVSNEDNMFLIRADMANPTDQILSTFKFLGQGQSCSSVNIGLSLTLPTQDWQCSVDNLGKEQVHSDGIIALKSPIFTVQISSLGRGAACDLSDPDPSSPRYDPTNACSISEFYSKNDLVLKTYKLSGQTKEIFGQINNGPSVSITYSGMDKRDLTVNEKSELIKLLDSIKVTK